MSSIYRRCGFSGAGIKCHKHWRYDGFAGGRKAERSFGRRKTVVLSLVPYVICLLLCFLTKNKYVFLVSYLLSSSSW